MSGSHVAEPAEDRLYVVGLLVGHPDDVQAQLCDHAHPSRLLQQVDVRQTQRLRKRQRDRVRVAGVRLVFFHVPSVRHRPRNLELFEQDLTVMATKRF